MLARIKTRTKTYQRCKYVPGIRFKEKGPKFFPWA